MDIMTLTRELGKALQNDDRYIAYQVAKQRNDEDAELQALMDDFHTTQKQLNTELIKENKDTENIKTLNEHMQSVYNEVMSNPNMKAFSEAQSELELLVGNIQQIISLCANGEDPDTCEPSTGCTGSCETCGGCG